LAVFALPDPMTAALPGHTRTLGESGA
jgi:hypothetical protein